MNFEANIRHPETSNEQVETESILSTTSEKLVRETDQNSSTSDLQNKERRRYPDELFNISVYSSKAPRASKPEPLKLEDPINGPFNTASEFTESLLENFSEIDRDGNDSISLQEIKTLAQNSQPKTIGSNLADILERRLEDLSGLRGFENNKISIKDVDKLQSLFKPKSNLSGRGRSASFGKVMSRSITGGAIGGGLGSSLSGGGFFKGAGKGAAVGTAIGLVAYGIANGGSNGQSGSNYYWNREIDSWNEFETPILDKNRYFDSRRTTKLVNTELLVNRYYVEKLERHNQSYVDATLGQLNLVESTINMMRENNTPTQDISPTEIQKNIDSFSSQFSMVDVDGDNKLNFDELANSIDGDKLSSKNKQIAAVLAQNIDVFSKFNDNESGELYLTRNNLSNTKEMFQEYSFLKKVVAHAPTIGSMAIVGIPGCAVGSLVGVLAGSPPIGCAAGASVFIGAGEAFTGNLATVPKSPLDKMVGTKRANNFRADIGLISH